MVKLQVKSPHRGLYILSNITTARLLTPAVIRNTSVSYGLKLHHRRKQPRRNQVSIATSNQNIREYMVYEHRTQTHTQKNTKNLRFTPQTHSHMGQGLPPHKCKVQFEYGNLTSVRVSSKPKQRPDVLITRSAQQHVVLQQRLCSSLVSDFSRTYNKFFWVTWTLQTPRATL